MSSHPPISITITINATFDALALDVLRRIARDGDTTLRGAFAAILQHHPDLLQRACESAVMRAMTREEASRMLGLPEATVTPASRRGPRPG